MAKSMGMGIFRLPQLQNRLTDFDEIPIFVTGSIARSASLPVFSLLRGRF